MRPAWKFSLAALLVAGMLADCAGMAAATSASEKAKDGMSSKPSPSDIVVCDDFNTDFAQLRAESPFVDVNVLQVINDGLKAKDPGIRTATHRLGLQLSDQALRSGAPTQTYELYPLTWPLFSDFYALGAACNRFGIGPP